MWRETLAKLETRDPVQISPEELAELLGAATVVREADTVINKSIRLLELEDRLFLQEYSFSGDIYLRRAESRETAEAFIESRLDTYDRMWDGCGCKIDFEARS